MGILKPKQFITQRDQMRGGERPVSVLDSMQEFDQQIAPTRCIAQERTYFRNRLRIGDTAFRLRTHFALRATGLDDRDHGHGGMAYVQRAAER